MILFIDGLVQEPEDEFVIEGPGLVQELVVAEVYAPPSSFLVSPIVPPTGNPPSALQPQPFSTLAGSGGGGDKHVFCMRRGYWNAMGIFSQEGGGNPRF